MQTQTNNAALDAVLATDLSDATDRLILADWLEEYCGVADASGLRRTSESVRRHVRWMVRPDMPEVLQSEAARPDAWGEEHMLGVLRAQNVIGMVIEGRPGKRVSDWPVAGHMIYELQKHHLTVLRMCVHPDYRGQTCLRLMSEKLYAKLSSHRRERMTFDVPAADLDTICALVRCGWAVTLASNETVRLERRVGGEKSPPPWKMP